MPAPRRYLEDRECIETLLARWEGDNRFYKVDLLSVDKKAAKCMVKFEDGQSCPIDNKDLHISLDLEKINDEAILCCLCEKDNSNAPNLIIICDLCNLGYHVGCHNPPIDASFWDDSDKEWFCDTCNEISNPTKRKRRRSSDEDYKTSPLRRKSKSARKSSTPRKMAKNLNKKSNGTPQAKRARKNLVVSFSPDGEELSPSKGEKRVEKVREKIQEELKEKPASLEVSLVAPENQDPVVDGVEDLRITESDKRERLADGSMVEQMDPIVIQTAKSLTDSAPTEDFLTCLAPSESVQSNQVKSAKVKQGTNKLAKIKIPRKKDLAKPEPA